MSGAQAEAQAMIEVDGEDASTALRVYSSCLDMLELQLELSVNSVASSAYSAELIGEELMDDVLDKNPMSQFERTLFLLRNIGKKMRKPEEATVVMKQFLEILENEAAFDYLVERIKTACAEKPNSERAVFTKQQRDLAQILQGSINSVATAAFSCDLIASDIKDAAVNAKAGHNKLQIQKILEEIRKQIIVDPGKLKVFIDAVMKDIGPSVQHLTTRLEKGLEGAPMDTC